MTDPADKGAILGVILAGGRSRRMGGGDKCLRMLAGKTLLARVIEALAPQVGELILNANGDASRFADFGLAVAADTVDGFAGPLAGVLAGMEWARDHRPLCRWIVTAPSDTPFLPGDLAARCLDAIDRQGARMASVSSNGRRHPVIGVWPVDLAGDLRDAITGEDMRKIDAWTARYNLTSVEWPAEGADPFFNINDDDDLHEAERMLRAFSD